MFYNLAILLTISTIIFLFKYLKLHKLIKIYFNIITRRTHTTEKREEKLQTSVPCLCYCFLVEYLALAGLMNFLAQLSDKIHHFTVYNLMPLAFLTKLSKMH